MRKVGFTPEPLRVRGSRLLRCRSILRTKAKPVLPARYPRIGRQRGNEKTGSVIAPRPVKVPLIGLSVQHAPHGVSAGAFFIGVGLAARTDEGVEGEVVGPVRSGGLVMVGRPVAGE